ncbi:MAG: amino acid racemase [Sphingobacteriales bacterium]|nr:MAG: amino acid racemase [Sphingobacteriales bacterium]
MRLVNEGINNKLGGLNFAECLIYSLNFGDIQDKGWENAYELLFGACDSLKNAGVEAIAMCANTAHLFADKLQTEIGLPFIHIGTETANVVRQKGLKTVGLLGTKLTMEMDFYRNKLEDNGVTVLVPQSLQVRDYVQDTVKNELGKGFINEETRQRYLLIANELIDAGAEGIILGCTEIPMLISQADFSFPIFDTTKIHSDAIVKYMLS